MNVFKQLESQTRRLVDMLSFYSLFNKTFLELYYL
jgi:hypothetical protein